MREAAEIERVCPSLFVWSRYAPDVKADLFSTAVIVPAGAFIIDPIATDADALREALAPTEVAGVIVSNENHGRAAADIARNFAVEIYAHSDALAPIGLPSALGVRDGEQFAPGLTAIAIDGAPLGEIAIHAAGDGGSLIIGDALINMGSYGFTYLPPKYCRSHKEMRRSLRKLLDYGFERIAFAHGLPILTQAKRRLATLLESES